MRVKVRNKLVLILTPSCFSVFNYSVYGVIRNKKSGLFSIFSNGIAWRHNSIDLTFSERYGYTKYYKIGCWNIKLVADWKSLFFLLLAINVIKFVQAL